jgi:hypothetical protein
MANGDFEKGTWSQLPSNCTNSFTLGVDGDLKNELTHTLTLGLVPA